MVDTTQHCKEGDLDFISKLPESITAHIMSRLLCTEFAIRTSVLSRAWRFKWTTIDNVIIHDYDLTYVLSRGMSPWRNCTEANFVKYVDTILSLAKNVTSFNLNFNIEYDSSLMKTWIYNVLERANIKSIRLHCCSEVAIVLAQDLLDRTSLESLFIEAKKLTLNLPVMSCFPNLTTLCFRSIIIVNENSSTNTLMLKLPVLKSWSLSHCTWLNVKVVEIDAPLLTVFHSWTPFDHFGVDSIKIFGAKLATFETGGGLQEDYFIQTESTIVSAAFVNCNIEDLETDLAESGLKTRILMKGLSNLEHLKISEYMAKAIAHSRGIVALPRYDKLKRLILCSTFKEKFEWSSKAFFDLLHAAPILKLLAIDQVDGEGYDQDNNNNEEMKSVPRCITNHLEEVRFCYQAHDSTYEFQLEKFLLKNALQLRKFSISVRDGMPKDEIIERYQPFLKVRPA